MKKISLIWLWVFLIPLGLAAQNSIRKATAPKAKIVSVKDGKEMKMEDFKFGEETLVRITLEGGVQNVEHKTYVTSTNAVVKKVEENVYSVKPVTKEHVNLIVDVEIFEDFFFYQLKPKGKKKKMKKVMVTYPPEKYMVSYETYNVSD